MGLPLWGPSGMICKGISSCPSCQRLEAPLHSSLQFVAIPMISPRPRLLMDRSRASTEAPRMQPPPQLACLVLSCNCAVSVHTAPIAAGGLSPSAEQGFPTFLESRTAGTGSSVGVDGSLLAANSDPTPQEPDLPGFLGHPGEVTARIFCGPPGPRVASHPLVGGPQSTT